MSGSDTAAGFVSWAPLDSATEFVSIKRSASGTTGKRGSVVGSDMLAEVNIFADSVNAVLVREKVESAVEASTAGGSVMSVGVSVDQAASNVASVNSVGGGGGGNDPVSENPKGDWDLNGSLVESCATGSESFTVTELIISTGELGVKLVSLVSTFESTGSETVSKEVVIQTFGTIILRT